MFLWILPFCATVLKGVLGRKKKNISMQLAEVQDVENWYLSMLDLPPRANVVNLMGGQEIRRAQ